MPIELSGTPEPIRPYRPLATPNQNPALNDIAKAGNDAIGGSAFGVSPTVSNPQSLPESGYGKAAQMPRALPTDRNAGKAFMPGKSREAVPSASDMVRAHAHPLSGSRAGARGLFIRARRGVRPFNPATDVIADAFEM